MPETPENFSYDLVPYQEAAHFHTQPDRLAAIATLYGMNPAKVDRCRVLEVGCAGGGNVIPLAERFPNSQFVGIDLSSRQIADGRAIVSKLGLKNLDLLQMDILDVTPEMGTFDYVVAHGVYSWVPPAVAEKLLEICGRQLSPQGVAMISYNVLPGWHLNAMIRGLLLFHTRAVTDLDEKVRKSREIMTLFAQIVPAGFGHRGWFSRQEKSFQSWDAAYVLHDLLEVDNNPCYLREFVDRATRNGLKYVAEAGNVLTQFEGIPSDAMSRIRSMSTDSVELEQYGDFLFNTQFRRTILCRAGAELEARPSAARALNLYVSAPVKPNGPVNLMDASPTTFNVRLRTLTATDPFCKAILLALGEIWPRAISVGDLIARAQSALNRDVDSAAKTVLQTVLSAEMDLWTRPSDFITSASERPAISPYARLQAQKSPLITSRRHQHLHFDDLIRHTAARLDGSRDRTQLLEELAVLMAAGTLKSSQLALDPVDPAQARRILATPVEASLTALAQNALLIA